MTKEELSYKIVQKIREMNDHQTRFNELNKEISEMNIQLSKMEAEEKQG